MKNNKNDYMFKEVIIASGVIGIIQSIAIIAFDEFWMAMSVGVMVVLWSMYIIAIGICVFIEGVEHINQFFKKNRLKLQKPIVAVKKEEPKKQSYFINL